MSKHCDYKLVLQIKGKKRKWSGLLSCEPATITVVWTLNKLKKEGWGH